MSSTTKPTATWAILELPTARDGDSVHLLRERVLFTDIDQILIQRDPKPVLSRLAWINAPEISGPKADPINGPRATADAQSWLQSRWFPRGLVAVQYGFEKYGRPLVDVRTLGGESLSQWMMRFGNDGQGWSAYAG